MNTKSILLTSITLVLCALLIAPMPAKAEDPALKIFNVDTFEDLVDYDFDGECSASNGYVSYCSLRAAVTEAEYIMMGQHRDLLIRLPFGFYVLSAAGLPPLEDPYYGDLDFLSLPAEYAGNERTVTIEGTGDYPSVIDANGIDRVFEIGRYYNIILKNVIITHGVLVAYANEIVEGGGIYQHRYSTLELDKVRVTENQILCVNCRYTLGGGIHTDNGTLTINRSEIDNNIAMVGSAISFWGGDGSLLINTSAIHSNSMDEGRVIDGSGAWLNLINSTVEGEIDWKKGHVLVQNSTLSVIQGSGDYLSANLRMLPQGKYPTLRIKNSILINQPGDTPGSLAGPNCHFEDPGHISSKRLGGNVFSDNTCPHDIAQGDVILTNPMHALLGPLGNYGGRTPTRELLPGSPAINRRDGFCYVLWGNPSDPSSLESLLLLSDQRGVDRDRKCDSGAYEYWHKQYLPIILK